MSLHHLAGMRIQVPWQDLSQRIWGPSRRDALPPKPLGDLATARCSGGHEAPGGPQAGVLGKGPTQGGADGSAEQSGDKTLSVGGTRLPVAGVDSAAGAVPACRGPLGQEPLALSSVRHCPCGPVTGLGWEAVEQRLPQES